MSTKDNSFFKKVVSSIKNIEKYPEMATKPFSTFVIYLTKIMIIFTVIATLISLYVTSKKIDSAIQYIKNDLPNFEYSNHELKFNTEEFEIKPDSLVDLIIINTQNLQDDDIEKYKNKISGQDVGIVLLKDKLIIHMNNQLVDYSYENIENNFNITNLNKDDVLNYFTGSNLVMIYCGIFILTFISLFISYTLSIIIDIVALGIVGYFTALILRIRLKLKAVFKITIQALTLPIILNLLYIVVQAVFGFNIKYFEVMYISIAYIYIISAILMIKSDLIKRGQELSKIVEEQQRIKEELERKEKEEQEKKQEEKQEEEQEENNSENEKKEDKKEDNKKKENDDESKEEPQGENA